jgi:hypothetical protein
LEKLKSFLFIFLIISCNGFEQEDFEEEEKYYFTDIENKGKVKIKEEEFVKYNTKAVLMGENILLLDNENKVIEDITFLKGQIVEVEELSKTIRINEHKSSCKELLWAKIKSDKREGYIDANILYEVKVNENNQYLKFKNNVVSIVQTKSLVTKSKVIIDSILDITSVCGEYNPIVFIDSSSNYFGTLKNVASKYQNENEEFYTFYNDDDDLFYTKDSIINYKYEDGKWLLLIRRRKKDYNLLLKVAIYKTPSQEFIAEILNFGRERPKKP